MTKYAITLMGAATWILAAASTAGAAVIIENPNGAPSYSGDSNVLFNACGGDEVTGPALTVTGCLNSDHDYLVHFTGNENLEVEGGGQARVVDSAGDGFGFLEITTEEGSFSSLIVNIIASDFVNGQPQEGQVEITPFIGGVAQMSEIFDLSEAGNNWFGLYTDNDDLFSSVQFEIVGWGPDSIQFLGVEFDAFQQVRLAPGESDGGPGPGEVAEPASLGLLGLGLLGLGLGFRRRRNI